MAPFELGAVVEVFGLPRPELEIPWYDLRVCSLERGPMRAVGGFMMTTQNGLDVFAGADTVMVVAVPDVRGEVPPELVAALREAHDRGARVVSICAGASATDENRSRRRDTVSRREASLMFRKCSMRST